MTGSRTMVIASTREEDSQAIYSALLRAAMIAGVFVVIVLGLLLANHFGLKRSDPRNSGQLKTLMVDLHEHPRDEKIEGRIRAVDLHLRREYLGGIDFAQKGNYLLLIGVVGLLTAVSFAAKYHEMILLPQKETAEADDLKRAAVLGRRAVSMLGVVVICGFVFLAVTSRGDLAPGYAKAVRQYEKNPPPNFTNPNNALAGLPPAMMLNMVGRTPAAVPAATAAGAAGGAAPSTVPAAGAPSAEPTSLPNLAALPPATPATLGAVVAANPKSAPAGSPRPRSASQPHAKASGRALEAAFDSSDYSPSAQEYAQNWPCFRGPASGLASGSYLTQWSGPLTKLCCGRPRSGFRDGTHPLCGKTGSF